ncbi:butyrophilin subfamily 1 member A1-like isoform X3 [Delphinapterus leucas]|uniref:Butyrophilin subfamily 1 member A1-like isoform X3 n=1 Tax=Delphinapterus leucas TaxID=9749 RepID=A0A2Y9MAE5_DELLE|nr:butyrophilin subfamily 1 member A1-like isoform X3 [Delphinapterus leucas]
MMTLKVSWFPNHPVGENGAKLESLSQPGPSATGLAQESRRVRRQPLCAPVPTVLGRFLLFSAGITPSTSGSGTLLLKDFPWAAAQTSLLLLLGLLLAALGFIWKLRQEKERERWTKGWRKAQKVDAHVTLDPDAAYSELFLSEDHRSVRWRKSWQDLPKKPESFSFEPCVLGHESFSSGRH